MNAINNSFLIFVLVAVATFSESYAQGASVDTSSSLRVIKQNRAAELQLTTEQKQRIKEIRSQKMTVLKAREEENKEFRKNVNLRAQRQMDSILNSTQKRKIDSFRSENKKLRLQRTTNLSNTRKGKKRLPASPSPPPPPPPPPPPVRN